MRDPYSHSAYWRARAIAFGGKTGGAWEGYPARWRRTLGRIWTPLRYILLGVFLTLATLGAVVAVGVSQ